MCSNSTTFTAIFVKLISTFINTQILHLHLTKESTNLQQFCPEILHSTTFFSKNSTSTNTLNFYNSTIFFWPFSTFYNDFLGQIYNLQKPQPPLLVGGLAEKNRCKLQIGPNSQDMFGISF